ncbi:MAG: 50S ribosomal protein L25 [Patescibacteria group bacterium]
MSQAVKLDVNPRKIAGRKVKQLRRQGIIPANIFGKSVKSLAIELPLKSFQTAFKTAGETNIIELQVAKETKTRPVLVHDIHYHPVTDQILHVDFHQVDLTQKVTVAVPIEVIGESPAVVQGGVLVQLLNELQVEALPRDLPDKFVIDASKLAAIGDGVTIKDLAVSDKVKFLAEKLDELVVKIEPPTKEEVEVKPAEAVIPAEGEAAKPEAKKEETPAEKPQPKAGQPMAEKK